MLGPKLFRVIIIANYFLREGSDFFVLSPSKVGRLIVGGSIASKGISGKMISGLSVVRGCSMCRKMVLAILMTVLLASTYAIAQSLKTPSGNPEVVIPNVSKVQVVNALTNALVTGGYKLVYQVAGGHSQKEKGQGDTG